MRPSIKLCFLNSVIIDKVLEDDFWCPTCQNTSQQSCDARLADTTCPKANFCMALWDKTVFARKCINKRMLDLLTKDCRNVGNMKRECKRPNRRYHLSWCNQPGCKAQVSDISRGESVVDKPAKMDFWCPTCQSTSQESCERTLTNTTCRKADHCMALWDKTVFARKCVNRKMLDLMTKNCRNIGSNEWECNRKRAYRVASCNQSGCKAEFSETTKDRLVVAKPARNDFWCPTCQSTSHESCEKTLTNTTCPKADHCMALWYKNVFARKCVNRELLDVLTKNCRNIGSNKWECNRKKHYHVTSCNQSGCKAPFSEITKDQPLAYTEPIKNVFWCPTCQSTSHESCEKSLANTTCPKADYCMALWDKNVFARKCVNRKMLELLTKNCRNIGSNEWKCSQKRAYRVASCAQSGCQAEFSETTKDRIVVAKPARNDFWCPTCESTSQEFCEKLLTNTTCPKGDRCMALWDKNIFVRKCVNRKMLELLTKNCRNTGSNEWKCSRKREYHVTACDQSGCLAKISGIIVPKEDPFQCPTCPICKSPGECDHKMTMTKCPTATRCMALHFNGTADTQGIFTRKCINEKMFVMIARACTLKQGCEVTSCTKSGCKAAL